MNEQLCPQMKKGTTRFSQPWGVQHGDRDGHNNLGSTQRPQLHILNKTVCRPYGICQAIPREDSEKVIYWSRFQFRRNLQWAASRYSNNTPTSLFLRVPNRELPPTADLLPVRPPRSPRRLENAVAASSLSPSRPLGPFGRTFVSTDWQ